VTEYELSHNPSDGWDEHEETPPEWGVWRTEYADHGGEG
jgi:hypothetical protein